MRYKIRSEMNGRLVAEESYSGVLFEAAKQHARDMVENGLATRTEIRDEQQNGKLVYHYPRTVSKAPD